MDDDARHALPRRTMLAPAPEAALDRFAELTRRVLGVPTALVSLVDRERQAFPGAAGLPEPWQTRRQTPLSHSFCQHVVASGRPLVLRDARLDPVLASNLAIPDLGVVGYAGMPLTNRAGDVVGSLCAIDSVAHDWTAAELANLADLAAACSSELQLREAAESASFQATRARALIDTMPVGYIAYDDEWRITAVNDEAASTSPYTVDELLGTVTWDAFPATVDSDFDRACHRVRETGTPEFLEYRYPESGKWYELRIANTPSGVSIFFTDVSERHRIQALLEQTAAHDRSVAQTLQQALLTALPAVPGMRLAARYLTAQGTDQVGGDWYDAVIQPDGSLFVSIGDVCGHDIAAAATMGQLRAMLRGFVWNDTETMAGSLTRLDKAACGHGGALATLITGRVHRPGAGSLAQLRWSNAGHPPPLLVSADGTVTRIESTPELMLGVAPQTERSDHCCDLPAGSTLILYTDGLIESRTLSLSEGIERLARALSEHHDASLDQLLDRTLLDLRADDQDDDIAVLAVHIDPEC